ncbi:MAG: hypothetical protein A3F13_09870 [Gammaproteobacteria bacterium RIFCSPHIGHO2_12_FULL_40_19]|nr:MAG: hypothetical protein A3F13_09870 [Gammaproteobacteria bacterium RIFCSPHIGHO2_12_FULL_40_19]
MLKKLMTMFSSLFRQQKSRQLTEFDNDVIILMNKHRINTVGYAIIDNFNIVAANTIGGNASININSIFQACSLSKSLTAYAALNLAAQNKLFLDLPINQQLKSWKLSHSEYADIVTVRHCLNMTSGLSFGDPGTFFSGYGQYAALPTLLQILKGEKPATNPPIKIIYEPGTKYFYSGAGFMILQQLIEDIVGMNFALYMNDKFLPKLGMLRSTFECPLSETYRKLAINGYKSDKQQIEGGWDHVVGSASGGLWSTPSDLANFCIYLSRLYVDKAGATVEKKLIKEMLAEYQNTDFGLGLVVDAVSGALNFRKNGHNAGYHCEMLMFPEYGKGVVVMTNSASGIEFVNEFIATISDELNWPAYRKDFNELVSSPVVKRLK